MDAKKPLFSEPVSKGRILAGVLVVFAVLWGLNRMREAFAEQDEVALLPADAQLTPLKGMEEIVSLDLRSTEATDAIKYLATKGGLNISISKNVSGRVNLFLTDVPLRDAFDLILRSNELAYDKQGSVYNIMTEEEYRKLYGQRFSDVRQVKTFRLQYAIPAQAFNLIDTLKSEVGKVLVDEDSGTVMILDTPEHLKSIEESLATLEQSGQVHTVDLKYAKAKDIEERLKDHVEANKLGYVKADERTNQVIIKAFPERIRELEQLIASLDRKTREVLIDAKIVKVTYTNSMDSGIDWDTVFSSLKFHGIEQAGIGGFGDFRNTTTGTAPSEVPALNKIPIKDFDLGGSSVKLGNLLFGTVSRDGYELFRYLETVGQTKIMSNPRLLVVENQEAKILVGTREAYVTTTTTTGQTTSTTAEDVQFIDVGIQLAVTPSINRDGYVSMKIKPEVSSVVRTLTTPSKNQIPIVDTSTAETNMVVADGMTVVLGGLRKDEKKHSNEQIPYLGRVPVIGSFLFKRVDRDDTLSELVVFITPHIIKDDDTQPLTGDERGHTLDYRDYAPTLSDRPSRKERSKAAEE